MPLPAIPAVSLVSQWSHQIQLGKATWTGGSQTCLRFILWMDFICLLQFPENHLQGKIHFSLQDSWYPWASASFTSKKTRWFFINLQPNSWVRLLFHHTGGQASTVSNWIWTLSCDLCNIYRVREMYSRNAMIILISLERLHAFPCLRSSSLGNHLKKPTMSENMSSARDLSIFCLGHNKMQEIESKCIPKTISFSCRLLSLSYTNTKPWKMTDFKFVILAWNNI